MRIMRACAAASTVLLGLMLVGSSFAACSKAPAPSAVVAPLATSPEVNVPDTIASEPTPSASTLVASPTLASTTATSEAPDKPPTDCTNLLTELANEPPPNGIVMNNASADAGITDRLQPLMDTIKAQRDGFRCCLDLYARKNPGIQGIVLFRMKLSADGKVEDAGIVRADSSVATSDVESCMVSLAKSIAWAPSPSGKETVLTYPFAFMSRP